MALRLRLWRFACGFGAARLAGAAAPRLIALRLRGCAALYYASGSLNVTFVLINPGFISLEHHVKMKQENVTYTNLEPVFETPLTLQTIPYIFSPCTELAVPGCTR